MSQTPGSFGNISVVLEELLPSALKNYSRTGAFLGRSHDPRCPEKMLMTCLSHCSAFPSDTGYVCQQGRTACGDILNIAKPSRCCGCTLLQYVSSASLQESKQKKFLCWFQMHILINAAHHLRR